MIAASDPSKTIRKEVRERMRNIGIDIGKRKCIGLVPLRYFWPFHVDLGTNDDACGRIRGFDPCQIELFMGMMGVT